MRLTPQQAQRIIRAITPFLAGNSAELRLYGSRVYDDRKGGDIDLLLLVENPACIVTLTENKHHILAALKKQLGDQKIDLLIANKSTVNENHFLTLVYPESILLKQF